MLIDILSDGENYMEEPYSSKTIGIRILSE